MPPGDRSGIRTALFAVALLGLLPGCGDDGTAPGPPPNPPPPEARTYRMGWAPNPPRPEIELVLRVIDSMAVVSEAAILQQAVPWPELLAGASMDSLVEDRGSVADFLRAKGMEEIVFLVDPLDGLDRTREDTGLLEAGRSILEPEIRATHETWVRRIAARVRPAWLGLASEINTLGARGDAALYAELVDLVNELAPEVRAISPGTRVFVSFQADEARGFIPGPPVDHFAFIDDFDIDGLGLSSYPVFVFETPADMPDDYFRPFREATDLPLIMVEGGWSSRPTQAYDATPEEQVAFFRRFEGYLDAVEAELWVMLIFADLDIGSLGLPPDRAATLSLFAFMGIVDSGLRRKPAYAEWARIFGRPLPP